MADRLCLACINSYGARYSSMMRRVALLIAVGCLLAVVGCTKRTVEIVLIDSPIAISTEWITVRFPRPLKAGLGRIQELHAAVSAEQQGGTKLALRTPEGGSFWPEVEVENSDGQWVGLKGRGFGENGDKAIFSDRALSGNGEKYVAVRLKSVSPITVSKLSWYDYDPQDRW